MTVELRCLTNMAIVVDMNCMEAPDPFSDPFPLPPLPPLPPANLALKITTEPLWDFPIAKPLINISESLVNLI